MRRMTKAQASTLAAMNAVREGYEKGTRCVICHTNEAGTYHMFRIHPDGRKEAV